MKRKNILINSKKINNNNNKVNTSYSVESNSNNNNVIFIVSYNNNNNNNNNNLLCRFTALAYTTIQLFFTLVSFISHPVTNFSFFLLLKGFVTSWKRN